MKKYLSPFFVLAIIMLTIIVGIQTAEAENSATLDAVTGTRANLVNPNSERKAGAKIKLDARAKAQADLETKRQAAKDEILKLQAEKTKVQAELKMKREAEKTEIKNKKAEVKNEMREKRDEIKTNMEKKKAELKTQIRNKREELQAEIKINREESKQIIEDFKSKIKEEKDETKAKIKEMRITGRENALKRFDEAVERISILKEKVNAQIARLEERGVDVSKAENLAATAEIKLSDAKAKIAEANALFSVSIDELSAENRAKFAVLAKEIQNLIKETHQTLNSAINSLREAIKIKIEAGVSADAAISTTKETSQ